MTLLKIMSDMVIILLIWYSTIDKTPYLLRCLYFLQMDIPGLGFSTGEYYPYVFFKLNIDPLSDPQALDTHKFFGVYF